MTKDWMQINILVPNDITLGPQILQILTDLGFTEADWCEYVRIILLTEYDFR